MEHGVLRSTDVKIDPSAGVIADFIAGHPIAFSSFVHKTD